MLSTHSRSKEAFRKTVYLHYRKKGRHSLPWRKTKDPYRILVSEMMLQQTQVDRVLPKYRTFLKKFPDMHALAEAPLGSVLKEWQGLGYNRRAKFLHDAAKEIMKTYRGRFPKTHGELVGLPGIGTYTASAIRAFAWNEPEIFIETNIRTAFIHYFFTKRHNIRDAELAALLATTLDKKNPREWHYALMDYGAFIKKNEGNASRRSAHHAKQEPFKGSDREVRGAILRLLSSGSCGESGLFALPFTQKRIRDQIKKLR
ncbi:MAG: hypothetical protein JO026_01495, partial [Patescibacteria group bacterium]|nr:hypothetical protein [Patescibacteria group bacterium]